MASFLTDYPLAEAAGITLAFGVAAWVAGTVSRSGFTGGVIIGAAIYYSAGWPAFAVLGTFFVLASALTRFGYGRKQALGAAQQDSGRRGARHAAANCAAGLALAVIFRLTGGNEAVAAAYVASFATAAADTAGTEVGSALGRRAFLPLTLERVEPGTPGAVSMEGTLASLLAAAVLGLLALAVGLAATPLTAGIIIASAFLAALAESLLGSLRAVEQALGNEGMNVFNTVLGALICLLAVTLTT